MLLLEAALDVVDVGFTVMVVLLLLVPGAKFGMGTGVIVEEVLLLEYFNEEGAVVADEVDPADKGSDGDAEGDDDNRDDEEEDKEEEEEEEEELEDSLKLPGL